SAFYDDMLWVVDGMRRKRELPRFFQELKHWRRWNKHIFSSPYVEEALPAEWLRCSKPVFFDFGEVDETSRPRLTGSDDLWCLLPGSVGGQGVVAAIPRTMFIESCRNGRVAVDARHLLQIIAKNIENE